MVPFKCRGDQDQRTIVQTRGGVHLQLGGSGHPMAKRLHRLALGGARPLAVWISTRFQSRLNAGAPIV